MILPNDIIYEILKHRSNILRREFRERSKSKLEAVYPMWVSGFIIGNDSGVFDLKRDDGYLQCVEIDVEREFVVHTIHYKTKGEYENMDIVIRNGIATPIQYICS